MGIHSVLKRAGEVTLLGLTPWRVSVCKGGLGGGGVRGLCRGLWSLTPKPPDRLCPPRPLCFAPGLVPAAPAGGGFVLGFLSRLFSRRLRSC